MNVLRLYSSNEAAAQAASAYRIERLTGEGVEKVRLAELIEGDEVVLRAGDQVPAFGRVVAGRAGVRLFSRSGTTPVETVGTGAELPAQTEIVTGSLVVALERRPGAQSQQSPRAKEETMEPEVQQTEHDRNAMRLAATMVGSAIGVAAIALLGGGSVVSVGIAGVFCGVMALGKA